mmetsp:Transcript_32980/g.47662  ORF Transcript_32980/g.47662 Transcript_32980/m.47662 type:complete len:163 (-) Transcript_32980:168-656(-)
MKTFTMMLSSMILLLQKCNTNWNWKINQTYHLCDVVYRVDVHLLHCAMKRSENHDFDKRNILNVLQSKLGPAKIDCGFYSSFHPSFHSQVPLKSKRETTLVVSSFDKSPLEVKFNERTENDLNVYQPRLDLMEPPLPPIPPPPKTRSFDEGPYHKVDEETDP